MLANVAYAPPVTRGVRAANAKVHVNTRFNAKQTARNTVPYVLNMPAP